MTEEEKKSQIEKTESIPVPEVSGVINDLELLAPEPVPFKIGDREYGLLPLKLKDMRLLVQLSEIRKIGESAEQLDKVVGILSKLLKESDTEFLEEHLDIPTLMALFKIIQQITYGPIPKKKGTSSGN